MVGVPSTRQSVGRFDRQQTAGRDLPLNLGRATEEFGALLDRHMAAVVAAAETRAAEVEREADRYAATKRHESEANAQLMLEGALARASGVLDSIGLVESALSGMLDTLRAEFAELAPATSSEGAPRGGSPLVELSSHRPAPESSPASSELPAPPPAAAPEPLSPQPRQATETAEQPDETLKPAQSAGPNVELDHLIRAQVRDMVANGKPRVEVERFVGRFPLGDNYIGMLDHLYTTPTHRPPRRRSLVGLWRRAR